MENNEDREPNVLAVTLVRVSRRQNSGEVINSRLFDVVNVVDALVVTDWDEFAVLDEEFDTMATSVVVDG